MVSREPLFRPPPPPAPWHGRHCCEKWRLTRYYCGDARPLWHTDVADRAGMRRNDSKNASAKQCSHFTGMRYFRESKLVAGKNQKWSARPLHNRNQNSDFPFTAQQSAQVRTGYGARRRTRLARRLLVLRVASLAGPLDHSLALH
jgi:hypothetical protein